MGRAINKTVMIAELIKVTNIICLFFRSINMGHFGYITFCYICYICSLTLVSLFQRRIAGLHQNTSIGSTDITDMWEPLEEGLLP